MPSRLKGATPRPLLQEGHRPCLYKKLLFATACPPFGAAHASLPGGDHVHSPININRLPSRASRLVFLSPLARGVA